MNRFVDTMVEPVLWLLADWSLRWAVLIGIYAAWLALFRPRRAALRYQVGLGVLLACVLLTAGPRWGSGFARWPTPAASPTRTAEAPPPSSAMIQEGDPAGANSSTVAHEDNQPNLSPLCRRNTAMANRSPIRQSRNPSARAGCFAWQWQAPGWWVWP